MKLQKNQIEESQNENNEQKIECGSSGISQKNCGLEHFCLRIVKKLKKSQEKQLSFCLKLQKKCIFVKFSLKSIFFRMFVVLLETKLRKP